MGPDGQRILDNLGVVDRERASRRADRALSARVDAVKQYQHARFERTYSDLLESPRYRRAARFFLEDLYGPYDFSRRDEQFARIVPGLVRLFPAEIVRTVVALSELHALSETLDSAMARRLTSDRIDAGTYVRAWQAACTAAERETQIRDMLAVGEALDRYTRNPVLRHSLRLMRGPAQVAGLGALQSFLENGFDTFREMCGAGDFLRTIARRERELVAALFSADALSRLTPEKAAALDPLLGQLP
jgi:hypothetical protein